MYTGQNSAIVQEFIRPIPHCRGETENLFDRNGMGMCVYVHVYMSGINIGMNTGKESHCTFFKAVASGSLISN